MTTSPTAAFLKLAIANSDLTQREIAQQAGLPKPNVLSMMKTGETKVPLNRIPALAEACRVDAATFIRIAMTEYHPEIWRVLEAEFSSEASRDERALLDALFSVNVTSQVIWDEPLLKAIRGVIELGQARPRTRQDITEEEIDRLLG
ncbi:transcriptional regulator with XRE-family HTH domain [Limimaricola variabilis]|uniref:Transcriptional regulator with XRE-family HTH domain n=1 Tax=Limimaricola variabilis TaxID=1492771 RepID=A0ABR6HS48_9RHOB|nr:helix-turn-helix transcriptional regulator [Limimaricola variabilis]MBB3713292.1 transcriptional regulator with XRE-family HTH domain [Limimaricola variabilis]